MNPAYYQNFAQDYNCGVYGQSTYQGASCSGTTAAPAGNGLSNTGIAIAGITTLAAFILLTALLVRIWKRPGRSGDRSSQ